jgi:medium-chain acyl-[acyl-carrier-protein] hydrolase
MTNENRPVYEETLRIAGFDCDFNHTLKPAAFFRHLTEAAGVHAEILGAGFDAMLARNLFWVHSRMKIQFYEFPRVGEMITLRTWPKTIQQKLFFIRDYEVLNASGKRIAAATSAWLVIDAATRRMVPSQSAAINLPGNPDRIGLDEPLEKLGLAKNGEERLRMHAGYSSLDLLNHVNNSRYVEWICDAIPLETFSRKKLDWLQINYDHETRPGEEVAIRVNPVENNANLWALEGINLSTGLRAFESVMGWKD